MAMGRERERERGCALTVGSFFGRMANLDSAPRSALSEIERVEQCTRATSVSRLGV